MAQNIAPAICSNCRTEDPDPDHRVPCTNCGDTRRTFQRQILEHNIPVTDHVSVTATFHTIREFYRDNPKLIRLHIAYWLGAAIVGDLIYPFDHAIAFAVGLIVGAMSFVRPPYTKNQP